MFDATGIHPIAASQYSSPFVVANVQSRFLGCVGAPETSVEWCSGRVSNGVLVEFYWHSRGAAKAERISAVRRAFVFGPCPVEPDFLRIDGSRASSGEVIESCGTQL